MRREWKQFQGIFQIQGLNPGLLHYRQILYQLSHEGSPHRQYSCITAATIFNPIWQGSITETSNWNKPINFTLLSKKKWNKEDFVKIWEFIFCCSVQFSSVTQSCMTVCDPMDCSALCFPVLHQLPEFIQTHVHPVGDAIQPSHPHCPLLLPPSIFFSIRVFSSDSVLHLR